MTKRFVLENAPTRAGAYSHAVVANGFVYVSGQGPSDPQTGIMPEAFGDQVRNTFENLALILEGAGCSKADVVQLNVYLSDLANFEEFNAIFTESFGEILPTRTTIGCQLMGIMIEVDCVAVI